MKGTLLICIIHPYSVLAGPNIIGTMFRLFYIFGMEDLQVFGCQKKKHKDDE